MPLSATLRKVPTWGWLVVGGATLGIGYRFYQDRRTADALPGPAGEETALAAAPDYMVSETPVAMPSTPVVIDPGGGASEVGSIGQTAIETVIGGITGIVEGIPAIIDAARPDPVETQPISISIPATPAPGPAPIPQAPAPTPAAPTSVTILGRRFVGAYRYSEIPTPNLRSRDFNVYYRKPHPDERWRRAPDGDWRKIADGNFGG